jgi:hypothetical protein
MGTRCQDGQSMKLAKWRSSVVCCGHVFIRLDLENKWCLAPHFRDACPITEVVQLILAHGTRERLRVEDRTSSMVPGQRQGRDPGVPPPAVIGGFPNVKLSSTLQDVLESDVLARRARWHRPTTLSGWCKVCQGKDSKRGGFVLSRKIRGALGRKRDVCRSCAWPFGFEIVSFGKLGRGGFVPAKLCKHPPAVGH